MTEKTPDSYQPDIDGLRALAVLAVIFFHFKVPGFSGGFTGVDVFFVISGFLIIRIIVREIEAGTFTLTNFYERRIRRIVPALTVVLLAAALASYFLVLLPSDLSNFGKTLMMQSLFLSNMWFMAESDYFAVPAESMPLLHTWTLALEEQFYILFPLLILLFSYLIARPKRYLKHFLIFLASASFAYSLLLAYGSPDAGFTIGGLPHVWGSATNLSAAFYFLLPRLWEFVAGGVVAVFAFKLHNQQVAEAVSLVGIGGILAGVFFITEATVFPGIAVLFPVLGTAAVIVANSHTKTQVGKALSYAPLVLVGLWSYSLYLWHWPLLVLAQAQQSSIETLTAGTKFLLLGATFVLAFLTYKFVETPIRKKQFLKKTSHLYLAGATALIVTLNVGYLFVESGGYPERLSERSQLLAVAMSDGNARQEECFTKATFVASEEPCLLGEQNAEKIEFVLWGDSHANAAMSAFDEYGIATNKTGIFFGAPACAPIPSDPPVSDDPRCLEEIKNAINYIKLQKPKEVFIISEWRTSYEPIGSGREYYLSWLLGSTLNLIPQETTVTVFHRLPSFQEINFRDLFLQTELTGLGMQMWIPQDAYMTNHQQFYDEINLAVKGRLNVRTLDPVDTMCQESVCYLGTQEGVYFTDASHLSQYGARKIILPLLLGVE